MALGRKDIIQLIALINSNYPANKYEPTEMMVDMWLATLGHYNMETLKLAVFRTISTCKFPPTVSDINNALKELFLIGLPSSGEAWELVMKQIGNDGYKTMYAPYKYANDNGYGYMTRLVELCETEEAAKKLAGEKGTVSPVLVRVMNFYDKNSLVAKAVELMGGLENIETSDNMDITRTQFFKTYNELRDRAADLYITPEAMKKKAVQIVLEEMQERAKMLEGEVV